MSSEPTLYEEGPYCAKIYLALGTELSSVILSARFLSPLWEYWGWMTYVKFVIWVLLNMAVTLTFSKMWPLSGLAVLNVMCALGVYLGWQPWVKYGFGGAVVITVPMALLAATVHKYSTKTMYFAGLVFCTLGSVFLFHEGMPWYGAVIIFLFTTYMVYDVGLMVDRTHRRIVVHNAIHLADYIAASVYIWHDMLGGIVAAATFVRLIIM